MNVKNFIQRTAEQALAAEVVKDCKLCVVQADGTVDELCSKHFDEAMEAEVRLWEGTDEDAPYLQKQIRPSAPKLTCGKIRF